MKKKVETENSIPAEADLTRKQQAEQKAARNSAINARLDKDYDGYYNDIIPIDSETTSQQLDKETIKKIALIGAGAVGIIILAILVLLFL